MNSRYGLIHKKPFFSIVIVSLNPGNKIFDTIDSILLQDFKDYEIIVKDGLSSNIDLKQVKNKVSLLLSQKDDGIYDAMNQACPLINGLYVLFLNCGDKFYDKEVLTTVFNILKSNHYDVLFGNYIRNGYVFKQSKNINSFNIFRKPINQQTLFHKLDLLKMLNYFDLNYKIASDYDFQVKLFFKRIKFNHINKIFVNYEGGGYSENSQNSSQGYKEINAIRKKYFKNYIFFNLIQFLSLEKLRRDLIFSKDNTFLKKLFFKIFKRKE
jgi:glycosyltransferase involved in cell wall biosynthesis